MTEHTKTDGLPVLPADDSALPQVLERARPRNERMAGNKIECNACPVLCQISPGRSGACDRYANANGVLIRVDPVVLLRRTLAHAGFTEQAHRHETPRGSLRPTAKLREHLEVTFVDR